MKEQKAIDAIVQECINTWPATAEKATAAGYTFCVIGYFEIPDNEHSRFHPVIAPLLEDIESRGAQALVFRPNMDGVYDRTDRNIIAYAQTPWSAPVHDGQGVAGAREVRLLSNDYIRNRDVTVDEDPQEQVRGLAFPQHAVPTFRSTQPGEHITGAVGVCWRQPRLK